MRPFGAGLTGRGADAKLVVVSQLSKRARSVLYAVVTEFTATGEPVGSRTLAKKYGFDLSAATIRNVLADLEEAGYLSQPHTSAGRIPTESAFRLFIDALMRIRKLSQDQVSKIDELFDELPPGTDIMRATGRILANLTGAIGVVARSPIESRKLLKLRFIPTGPKEILAVIVFSGGAVENRFLSVEAPPKERELERLHNLLEAVCSGRTLAGVREELSRLAAEARDELNEIVRAGERMLSAAMDGGSRHEDVVIEGAAQILERPEYADGERVRHIMRALEEREHLVSLLDRTLASDNVQVFLGDETNEMVGHPVSVVAAPYLEDGRPAGGLGIIGPTRMDYAGIVPLVGETARAVTDALARKRAASDEPSDEG